MKKLRNLIIALLIIPVMVSCSMNNNHSRENLDIVNKYVKAVESLDFETMESLLDDNYIGLGPSYTDSIGKEQAVLNWRYNVENLYESIKYNRAQVAPVTIHEGYNKGEWVSGWSELNITYKSGESVVIWANTAYKIENEKIVKSFTFYNEADVLEQLGYVFIDLN